MDRTWSRWNVGGKMCCWWWRNLSEDCTSFYDAAQKNMYEYDNVQLFMLFSWCFFVPTGWLCVSSVLDKFRDSAPRTHWLHLPILHLQTSIPQVHRPIPAHCLPLIHKSPFGLIVDMLFHKISFTVDPWYKQVFQRCCQQPSSCIVRIAVFISRSRAKHQKLGPADAKGRCCHAALPAATHAEPAAHAQIGANESQLRWWRSESFECRIVSRYLA